MQYIEAEGVQTKGAFFQKVRFVFQISQSPKNIIPKSYPELGISEKKPPLDRRVDRYVVANMRNWLIYKLTSKPVSFQTNQLA